MVSLPKFRRRCSSTSGDDERRNRTVYGQFTAGENGVQADSEGAFRYAFYGLVGSDQGQKEHTDAEDFEQSDLSDAPQDDRDWERGDADEDIIYVQ